LLFFHFDKKNCSQTSGDIYVYQQSNRGYGHKTQMLPFDAAQAVRKKPQYEVNIVLTSNM